MKIIIAVIALTSACYAQVVNPGAGTTGGTIPSTTSALKGDGAGGAAAVTGTGTNCVHVDGTSASCAAGTGTVTVVGSGSLGSTQIATGGGANTIQTPSSGATVDGSGNATFSSVSTSGGSLAGYFQLGQGTAPSLGTTSVQFVAPASVTSYQFIWPGASGTGFLFDTGSSNVDTVTRVGSTGTGSVVLASSPTIVTPVIASFTNATHNHSNAAGGGTLAFGTALTNLSGDVSTSGSSASTLATKYKTFLCEPGIGDGLNAIASGTYLQSNCINEFGATYTITGVWCLTDNAGSSTMSITNGAGTALLTGAITCSNTFPGVAGTQGGTTTIANADGIKFSFVADGTSKQVTWVVAGTR